MNISFEELKRELEEGIKAPYVKVSKAPLGGFVISVSMDEESSWDNGIMMNSRYLKLVLHLDGELSLAAQYYKFKEKFRKARISDAKQIISKVNKFIEKNKAVNEAYKTMIMSKITRKKHSVGASKNKIQKLSAILESKKVLIKEEESSMSGDHYLTVSQEDGDAACEVITSMDIKHDVIGGNKMVFETPEDVEKALEALKRDKFEVTDSSIASGDGGDGDDDSDEMVEEMVNLIKESKVQGEKSLLWAGLGVKLGLIKDKQARKSAIRVMGIKKTGAFNGKAEGDSSKLVRRLAMKTINSKDVLGTWKKLAEEMGASEMSKDIFRTALITESTEQAHSLVKAWCEAGDAVDAEKAEDDLEDFLEADPANGQLAIAACEELCSEKSDEDKEKFMSALKELVDEAKGEGDGEGEGDDSEED